MAEDRKSTPKKYFQGVSAIREVPYGNESERKIIVSGYVPDMMVWLQENCTEDGWININIVPKQTPTEQRTHVAYLNERMTKSNGKSEEYPQV
jgi:hypothetical protein